jgi:hypothetical protein
VGGSFTNRTLGWHPITPDNWELGVNTFVEFLAPLHSMRTALSQNPVGIEIILVLIGLGLLDWVLYKGLPYFFRPAQVYRPDVLPFTNALYVIAYMSVLILTMTLFDPATKFQVRILSPTYVSLLLLLVALGTWLWRKKQIFWKPILSLCVLGSLGLFASGQVMSVQDFREGGEAFASEKWFDSDAIAALDQLPSNVLVLSNEPGVVYLYAGRPSGILPDEGPGMATIKQAVLDGKLAIILFRVNKVDDETLRYYYELGRGLYLTDFSNTWLFTAFPK